MNSILSKKINEYINKYNLDSLEITQDPREFIVMLLSDIMNTSIVNIKLSNIDIDTKYFIELENLLDKIVKSKTPPQYLTNIAYIYGNKFFVDKNVLIPRQDTETLIEIAVNEINNSNYKSLLDICTGSGIIGINCALKTNIKDVMLSDISDLALEVAKKNIENLHVTDKCTLLKSNMFEKLYNFKNKYDIIVSNPPYLNKMEMNEISDFVKNEPRIALEGGEDGLDFYRTIYENARFFLNDKGFIAVEIGYMQAKDVSNIIKKYDEYIDIKVIKDINNKDRVITCHFQK